MNVLAGVSQYKMKGNGMERKPPDSSAWALLLKTEQGNRKLLEGSSAPNSPPEQAEP